MGTLAEDVETLKRQFVAIDRQLKVYERLIDQTAGSLTMPGGITGSVLTATVPAGTAPIVVTSPTLVPNLNADMVDGKHVTGYTFVPLAAPLTSTSWDGDAFSTAAKTLIDLSVAFPGVPDGVKSILARVLARDSASLASDGSLGILLSPNSTSGNGPAHVRIGTLPNDSWAENNVAVPCDANGDIYYQTYASGAGTLDVHIQVWGYWI